MPPRIKRILIPFIIIGFISLSIQSVSTGQAPEYHSYLPLISYAPAGWIGPYGGWIVCVAFDPYDPQRAYAGTFGSGMYISTDGGVNWAPSNVGLTNLYINSLAIDPSHPSTIYAGTYRSQIYKSLDGGQSWTWSGSGMQNQAIVYSIAIDQVQNSTIFASTRGISNNGTAPWNGVVYKSSDAGQNWFPVLSNVGGADLQDWIYSLAVNPNHDYQVIAAAHQNGPYRSKLYGALGTWSQIPNGVTNLDGRAIGIGSFNGNDTTLFYAVWHQYTIYKSLDTGDTWFTPDPDIGWSKVYSLASDPTNINTIYLATFDRGILRSGNAGVSWQDAGLQNEQVYRVAINTASPSTLIAGTTGDGLFRYTNSGWQRSNTGINNSMVTSVILPANEPRTVIASIYGAGVYQSNNLGQAWSAMNTGLPDKFVHGLVLDPAHPNLLYAMTESNGLFWYDLSAGGGWTRISGSLPLTQTPMPAFSADHPFATREMQEDSATQQVNPNTNQTSYASLLAMTYAPSNPNIAYLGTVGSGVYKSIDAGLNWVPAGLGGESVTGVAVDLAYPNVVYAITEIPNVYTGKLKRSTDEGSTWEEIGQPLTYYSVAASRSSAGVLYAGTNNGIYRYQSGWSALGLPGQQVTSITVNPSQPNIIYAGTASGAYYSTNGGSGWNYVDESLGNQTVLLISFNPNNPKLVFFGTKTFGIFMSTIQY